MTKERKQEIIETYRRDEKDTRPYGSSQTKPIALAPYGRSGMAH